MTTTEPVSPTDRIVVGVDGSEPSRHALRWAHFIAATTGASIDAVGIWRAPAAASGPGWADVPVGWNRTKETEAMLDTVLQEVFGDKRPERLDSRVCEGNAAKVLIDASNGARMLIVGSRGRGGFVGLLLGSVSTACAAHAPCPVLVVHGDTPAPPAPSA